MNDEELKELFEFLRIKSVSGEKEYEGEIKRAAEFLVGKLSRLGFEARVMESGYNPVVYAEYKVGKVREGEIRELTPPDPLFRKEGGTEEGIDVDKIPTILIYGHYDVQSAEPLDQWKSDPFEPTVRDGSLYARGVADDKGQLFTWIVAIERMLGKQLIFNGSHKALGAGSWELGASKNRPHPNPPLGGEGIKHEGEGKIPFNVKFVIEGAEEQGSRGLSQFIKEHKEMLAADIVVISDSHSLSETQPVICYGLRGLTYMEIVVRSMPNDAHSGIYGGNIVNPAIELVRIIARMKDENGTVLIPGFYDKVRNLGDKERKELSKYPFGIEEIKSEIGVSVVSGEKEYSVPERAGSRPTLDVNGLWSGYTGEGSKTIIPAQASAKISMRLVPNQDSQDIAEKFTKFVHNITPKGVTVEIKQHTASEPVLVNRDSDYFKYAENAFIDVFGNKPLYELSGGSIGVVVDFKNTLGIDSLMMGYGLPDDGLHSPNEKMSLAMLKKGVETNVAFLRNVSDATIEGSS